MATHPLKSLFGSLLGFTRSDTTFTKGRLYSKVPLMAPSLYLHATEGSETKVDIQGFTDVETSSTGTAALATRGVTLLATAGSTLYTLAAPPGAGVRKVIISQSTTTKQITSAQHIVRGVASSGGGDSGIIAASTAHTIMSFTGIGNCIELFGLSTSAWACLSAAGFSSASTPITTA